MRGDPALRQALVFRRHHQVTGGQVPVHEHCPGRRRDHLHGVESRVEQLDDVRLELRHPVRTGETHVPAAKCQHLHDVLGLEGLGFGVLEGDVGAIAPGARANPDAGVAEQGQHSLFHAAFRQAESQQCRGTG